jgi:hypothetical protein
MLYFNKAAMTRNKYFHKVNKIFYYIFFFKSFPKKVKKAKNFHMSKKVIGL